MVFVFGIGAGLLLGVGFVLQQHVAATAPAEERLRLRILTDLARRPVWLGGIAAMAGGQILGAAALTQGDLTLVEALMATNVLFALPLASAWWRRRLGPKEWSGAVLVVAGLAVFVLAAHPGPVRASHIPWISWVIASATIAAVAAGTATAGKQMSPAREALAWGIGAGAIFGLQDALTQQVLQLHFAVSALETWPVWALLAASVVGLVMAQSAYQAAPLAASLPAMSTVEPITGICLGAGLFAQGLRLGPLPLVFELVGIAAMMGGVILLARSPVVTAGTAGEPGGEVLHGERRRARPPGS
jgi:drug/metabolite transporter (DMT)-like permease